MARDIKNYIDIINKLENIDFKSWLLKTKLCNDEEYNYKKRSWYIFGKKEFIDTKWSEEILSFKLNNDSITKSLIDFAKIIFR